MRTDDPMRERGAVSIFGDHWLLSGTTGLFLGIAGYSLEPPAYFWGSLATLWNHRPISGDRWLLSGTTGLFLGITGYSLEPPAYFWGSLATLWNHRPISGDRWLLSGTTGLFLGITGYSLEPLAYFEPLDNTGDTLNYSSPAAFCQEKPRCLGACWPD